MRSILIFLFLLCFFWLQCSQNSVAEDKQEANTFKTPQEVIHEITRGINIGNTLEPPLEGDWNNGPMQEYYFDDIKSAGFSAVRIPVRWDKHTDTLPPYSIHEDWLKRVEDVVDWALSRDLYVILNAHHEWWLVQNFTPEKQARFDSIWSQISLRFKNKSGKLLFEIINEPKGLTEQQINQLNAEVLNIIRKSNPNRIVIFSGNEWSNAEQLIRVEVPNDPYVMGYYHSYDPWSFAGEGKGTWGTQQDFDAMKAKFQMVKSWSEQHQIPVILSEFGAVRQCDYNSRMLYYFKVVEFALSYGVAFFAWDDGGNFGIYDRINRKWDEVKDILLHTYSDSPTNVNVSYTLNPSVVITWKNRDTQVQEIMVQRKTDNSEFMEIARLSPDSTRFEDTDVVNGSSYYYRIICRDSEGVDKYSYPVKINLP